ncbi:MAG TPA: histidinol-phosphatase HisJ family protein [Candidatus Cloacimonetes bacterium]|nr:histidinol-phosphatase HisJ family protein [Candidatus Cloacimonadota bacterium]
MYDYHLHTEYSFDSRIKGKELMEKAIALGYKEIAITEHLDLLPFEVRSHGIPALRKYWNYCQELQKEYPQIKLYCGLEIGDYHRTKDFALQLLEGFDFFPIMGSVHILEDNTNVAILLDGKLSKEHTIEYYNQNLELVKNCDIDILGHLGVYKRYYNQSLDERFVYPIIEEIFSALIERNIYLEVNLSSLNKPYQMIIPEPEMLDMYKEMGGKLLCIGSDTHRINEFVDNTPILQRFNLPSNPIKRFR